MNKPNENDPESKLAISNGVLLLNKGYNLGSAIECTRRDILNKDGYPTMSYAKLREALINSVDLLNAKGANEIKRISEWETFTIQGDQSHSIYELSCHEPKPRSINIDISDH